MARYVFPQWTETFKKLVGLLLLGGPIIPVAFVVYAASPEALKLGYEPVQPVPYSHALHVGELGLDCRYCHNTVEKSAYASLPPASTCMNCHAGVRPDSELLLPVREAFENKEKEGKPLAWIRVYDLPDYVYFNHSAHVTRGVGCESCHGRVDKMEVVHQVSSLTMTWCLDCHRNPTEHVRDKSRVTEMGYPYNAELEDASKRVTDSGIKPPTNCSTCHR